MNLFETANAVKRAQAGGKTGSFMETKCPNHFATS